MEKVKLTQEQADMIPKIKDVFSKVKFRDLAMALDGKYEVEPEFNVGDWVVRTEELNHQNHHRGKVFKIKSVIKGTLTGEMLVVDGDDNSEHLFNNIRHATPEEATEEKQRRFFAENGRKLWELKEGDVLEEDSINGRPVTVTRSNKSSGVFFRTPSLNYMFTEMDYIKKNYKVVCFAEDRKDV